MNTFTAGTMDEEVMALKAEAISKLGFEVTEYFGGCPECGSQDGYLNIGQSHWVFCEKHQTRWCIGSNLFSSWRDETEEEQLERAQVMYDPEVNLRPGWRDVKPLPTTDPSNYADADCYRRAMAEIIEPTVGARH
jgi:hypothetical protein